MRIAETGRPLAKCLLLLLLASCGGCYYMQAATGQWQLMRKREPISEVIADAGTPAELAARLQLVEAARQFSIDELALPDNDSYRSYADIEREFVVWNVFAAPEFSLEPRRWCFPVVGCVSYRGYFARDDAYRASERLAKKGFDVAVGGVTAYSTLGNFDDPVLSSMMRWDDIQLVAVLFHELAHQVLYIKGDTGFNESFASAVEEIGIDRWLTSRGQAEDMTAYHERRTLQRDLMALVTAARRDLENLYAEALGDADKRQRKAQRLDRLRRAATERLAESGRHGDHWLSKDLNNARLVSMSLYEGRLPAFRVLFERCSRDIVCFYEQAIELSELAETERNEALDDLARGQVLGSRDRLDDAQFIGQAPDMPRHAPMENSLRGHHALDIAACFVERNILDPDARVDDPLVG